MKFISSLLLFIVFSAIPLAISKAMTSSEKYSLSTMKKVHSGKKSKGEGNEEPNLSIPPQKKYKIIARDTKYGIVGEYSADLTYSDAGIWLIIYEHTKEITNILVDSYKVIKVAEQAEAEEKLAKNLEAIVYHIDPSKVQEKEADESDSKKLKEEFRKNSEQHSYLIPFRVVKDCEYKLIGPDQFRKSNSISFRTIQEATPYSFIQGKPIGLSYLDIEIWVDDAWVEYTEIKEENINTLAEACTKNREDLKLAAKLYMEKFNYRKQTAEKEREINKKIKESEALWKLMAEKMKKYKQLFSSYGFAPAKIEEELVKINELKDGEPTETVTFTYLKELQVHDETKE